MKQCGSFHVTPEPGQRLRPSVTHCSGSGLCFCFGPCSAQCEYTIKEALSRYDVFHFDRRFIDGHVKCLADAAKEEKAASGTFVINWANMALTDYRTWYYCNKGRTTFIRHYNFITKNTFVTYKIRTLKCLFKNKLCNYFKPCSCVFPVLIFDPKLFSFFSFRSYLYKRGGQYFSNISLTCGNELILEPSFFTNSVNV